MLLHIKTLNTPTEFTFNEKLDTSENFPFIQNMTFKKSKRGRKRKCVEYSVEDYCQAMVDCKVFLKLFDGKSAKSCFRQVGMVFLESKKKEKMIQATSHSIWFFTKHKAEIESYFKANYGEANNQSDGLIEFPNKTYDVLGSF